MRLIVAAIGTLTFLYFGILSLDYQSTRTESNINVTANTGEAFNVSQSVLGDATTTLGVATPNFFLAGLVAFIATLLWVVLK